MLVLNFVEIMTLYRTIIVGRFKCLGATAKISADDYDFEGYVISIEKSSIKENCLHCVKNFVKSSNIWFREDKSHLTIHAPY